MQKTTRALQLRRMMKRLRTSRSTIFFLHTKIFTENNQKKIFAVTAVPLGVTNVRAVVDDDTGMYIDITYDWSPAMMNEDEILRGVPVNDTSYGVLRSSLDEAIVAAQGGLSSRDIYPKTTIRVQLPVQADTAHDSKIVFYSPAAGFVKVIVNAAERVPATATSSAAIIID